MPFTRSSIIERGLEKKILPALREMGISVTAYGVLSRGLLGGNWRGPASAAPGDMRARFPRFSEEHLEANLNLVDQLAEIAKSKGVTVGQLAIAWVASRGDDIIPLIGARRPDQIREAVHALSIPLSTDDLAAIDHAAPITRVSGTRYAAEQMGSLDSER